MRDNAVLVTGAAGFIGFHVAQRLLFEGREVVGLDIVNSYYDPKLKEARLDILEHHPGFTFVKLDLTAGSAVQALFERHRFPLVVHLAAQAGVRYSLKFRQRTNIAVVLQKGRKRLTIRVQGSSLDPGSVPPVGSQIRQIFPPPDFGGRHGDIHAIAKATGFRGSCGTR
jgi:GDP-D-mannose dehydratase